MQNNWFSCLLIIEFADNNVYFAAIKMTSFFVNKNFYLRMSFSFDFTAYDFKREQLQATKVDVIADLMQKTLRVIMINVKTVKKKIITQTNVHRKKIIYKENDIMFLSSRNIKTVKLMKKLKNKMLSSFRTKKVLNSFYKLNLSSTMKMHDVFYFSLLQKNAQNLLSD